MHQQRLKLLRLSAKEKMHLQENIFFDLDLWVKVTLNVAQYPLHHITYADTSFEVATSNGLGKDTFTKSVNYFGLHRLCP